MKKETVDKINTLLKEGGSLRMYYLDEMGYKWIDISVTDKVIDIYPYYSAKVSSIKSRPKFKVVSLNNKEMIELSNSGKHSFLYTFVCIPNTEKVTYSKNPKEFDEIV